jgi:hypothetical protein
MPEEIDQISTHHKHSFWEHHLGRWQQSELSQPAYCRKHNLKPHQFYYWRRRLLKPAADVSFLPLALPADPVRRAPAVRILMPNGFAIELEGRDEPAQLQQLVTMVAAL